LLGDVPDEPDPFQCTIASSLLSPRQGRNPDSPMLTRSKDSCSLSSDPRSARRLPTFAAKPTHGHSPQAISPLGLERAYVSRAHAGRTPVDRGANPRFRGSWAPPRSSCVRVPLSPYRALGFGRNHRFRRDLGSDSHALPRRQNVLDRNQVPSTHEPNAPFRRRVVIWAGGVSSGGRSMPF